MSGQHLQAGVAGDPRSPIHRLDPRAKLVGLASITFVAVSTPLGAWPVYAACAAALIAIAVLARVPARTIWSRARVVLPLVLFVALFLPFVRRGEQLDLGPISVSKDGLETFATVSAKAILGTLSAVMLGATTSFPDVLHALERLKAPKHALQAHAIGRVATALFLRTYERAERVHLAMLARGWRQNMPRLDTLAFTRTDTLFLAALATPLLAIRVLV
jgi:cobalt/nickel transport system permease protein